MSQPIRTRVFLNDNIKGEEGSVPGRRQFFRTDITEPAYDAQYFETAPTMWAGAYDFQQRLEAGEPEAVDEWMSLFLLHYFCILHLKEYTHEEIDRHYDRDLWPALERTFPHRKLEKITLLRANDGTVVGAAAPATVFFPIRGRVSWQRCNLLSPYLADNKFSWDGCRRKLLGDDAERMRDFVLRLHHIRTKAVAGELRQIIRNFSHKTFGTVDTDLLGDPPATMYADPKTWPGHQNTNVSTRELVDRYPLVREKYDPQNKNILIQRTFYLLDELPEQALTTWMISPAGPCLPFPVQFKYDAGQREIVVHTGGKTQRYKLQDTDRVVLLKDCFIRKPTYFSLPRDDHHSRINVLHLKPNSHRGTHEIVPREDEVVLFLAPVNETFVQEFPDAVNDSEGTLVSPSGTHWEFKLKSQRKVNDVWQENPFEVSWITEPEPMTTLAKAGLAIWPPKASAKWSLYVAYGTGTKEREAGRWRLVGEQGLADNFELEEKNGVEYLSVLQGGRSSNLPKAVMLTGPAGRTEGLLFLNLETFERPTRPVSLAFDFGTSNTCLAYNLNDASAQGSAANPQTFNFTLEPLSVLGAKDPTVKLNSYGFVPFVWSKKEGFYPSALSSRNWFGGRAVDQIKTGFEAPDLFRVNIPSLYFEKQVQENMLSGSLAATRNIHTNMKWRETDKENRTWRSLFIGLSLLYAHAELFFKENAPTLNGPGIVNDYVFTFPLAFPEAAEKNFHEDVTKIVKKVRSLCYVNPSDSINVRKMDESTAMACSVDPQSNKNTLEVFIDTGGGTTDIALRHAGNYLALDSFRISGKSFFQIAGKNFESPYSQRTDAARFRQHLNTMLRGDTGSNELSLAVAKPSLGDHYSFHISDLSKEEFEGREQDVRYEEFENEKQFSYQRYRTRLLFQHILAYALLQACAAVANDPKLSPSQLYLVLGGNAWGLLMFAGWERSKDTLKPIAEQILAKVKIELLPLYANDAKLKSRLERLSIFDVELLNQNELSQAKTAVATGALKSGGLRSLVPAPFAGITLNGIKLNDKPSLKLRWSDRWGLSDFKKMMRLSLAEDGWDHITNLEISQPDKPAEAIHPAVSLFTKLANLSGTSDTATAKQLNGINGRLSTGATYLEENHLGRQSPINYFVSEILYSGGASSILNEITLKQDPQGTPRK
jgi:hypothetical protein